MSKFLTKSKKTYFGAKTPIIRGFTDPKNRTEPNQVPIALIKSVQDRICSTETDKAEIEIE